MRFTNYFSRILKEQGTPQIKLKYYQTMLNVIIIENNIELLNSLQIKEHNTDRKYFLKSDISGLKSKLNMLTMENKPENMLKYWLNESRFEL